MQYFFPSTRSSRSTFPSSSLVLSSILAVTSLVSSTQAQFIVNGQIFTNGLAIVDAPQPFTQFNSPGDIPIAIDVSGNGALPSSASNLNSTSDATGFQLLEIFLVSKDLGLNVTVSSGPGLLNGELGSTVKHVDFRLPGCIGSGNWNVTFHESSRINGTFHYTVTPIPITLQSNVSPLTECSNITNTLQTQPLADAALTSNPWGKNGSAFGQPVTTTSGGVAGKSVDVLLSAVAVGGVLTALSWI